MDHSFSFRQGREKTKKRYRTRVDVPPAVRALDRLERRGADHLAVGPHARARLRDVAQRVRLDVAEARAAAAEQAPRALGLRRVALDGRHAPLAPPEPDERGRVVDVGLFRLAGEQVEAAAA